MRYNMNMKRGRNFVICASAALLASTLPVRGGAEAAIDRSVMGETYWQLWNDDLQREIDARIEQNRKADWSGDGFPSSIEVRVEQIDSDFKVGCNIFNFDQLGDDAQNAEYKSAFRPGGLFNAATLPFYWHAMEPVQGQIRYTSTERDDPAFWKSFLKGRGVVRHSDKDCPWEWRRPSPDRVIAFCETNGVAMHGHVIIYPLAHPKWVAQESSKEEAAKLYEKRVYDIALYYKDRIPQWDVVNESVNRSSSTANPNDDIFWNETVPTVPWDYTFNAFRLAERLFPPSVKLVINDCWHDPYTQFITSLLRRGAKIDVVGIQMHIFVDDHAYAISQGKPQVTNGTLWAPEDQMKMLGELDACAHRPIHLSEVTIPAPRNVKGLSREKADAIQAQMVRDNFRLWFSWPSVNRITYWNLVDSVGGEILYSGFYNRDMTKKPAYFALHRLVNEEWRTNLRVKADVSGALTFRGFKGRYRLSWIGADGKPVSRIVEVK